MAIPISVPMSMSSIRCLGADPSGGPTLVSIQVCCGSFGMNNGELRCDVGVGETQLAGERLAPDRFIARAAIAVGDPQVEQSPAGENDPFTAATDGDDG
jgi:hypothetical protein